MGRLSGFDPLVFLGIKNLKGKEMQEVSNNLLNKISQYILIRISEQLPTEDVRRAKTPERLFSLAQERIPDLSQKMKLFLTDFRTEFGNNIKNR